MPPLTLKISASGLRGVVGESLTPQLVTSFAAAFGNYCGAGPVLLGAAEGASAEMVKQAAVAGLMSVGNEPVDLGLVPLPALMMYVRAAGARGAICIGLRPGAPDGALAGSGWSTIRFIGPDGSVLRANQAAELTDLYHQGVYARVRAPDILQVRHDERAVARHRAAVLAAVNVEAIAARRFRVAVAPDNGPTAAATRALLQALRCEVVSGDGEVARAVVDRGADVGFTQDGDGARLGLVDERGEALPPDGTIALAVEHHLGREPGPVVVNVSTSHMVEAAALRRGGSLVRTRVGESQVLDKMREVGALIGGEGDGGLLFPRVNPCRDSFLAMALLLEALASAPAALSERWAHLRSYVPLRDALFCPARETGPALRWLRHVYRSHPFDLTDGLKVLPSNDRWLHVRPAHDEPILRLTVEAPSRDEAQALLNEVLEHLSPEG